MAIAGLELKVDWHVNHLHRHVGEVEGGVEEDRDGHRQEHRDGGGHQGGQHSAGGRYQDDQEAGQISSTIQEEREDHERDT